MKKTRIRPAARSLRSRAAAAESQVVTVLHIDDDPNDIELFKAAARRAEVPFSLQTVTDGEQAMAYLSGKGQFADRQKYPVPAVILLDLKMPTTTGFEVLSWIRNHPEVGDVPVVVFSGSELSADKQLAYASGANSYVVKPIGFTALVELVKSITDSWVNTEVAPKAGPERRISPSAGWINEVVWSAEMRP